jgi:tetratricopeptide (TPR) repeat protein
LGTIVRPSWIKKASCVAAVLLCAGTGFGQGALPASEQAQIAAGVEALKSGELASAERIFSDALRRGVKHPLVFHDLGVIAQERGEHASAISRFRQAIALQPDYGPSHLLLGSSLLALHRNTEAVQELRRAVKLMPEQPQAHFQLARAYEASGDWINAVQQLQKVAGLAPDDPEYRYQLGKAWSRLSGWSYEQIKKRNPNSARLQQALGQEYALQGKYDLALAAYQKAASLDPKLPEIHYAIAVILLEQKKCDEAVAEVALELKLVPESKAASELKSKIEAARTGASPPS